MTTRCRIEATEDCDIAVFSRAQKLLRALPALAELQQATTMSLLNRYFSLMVSFRSRRRRQKAVKRHKARSLEVQSNRFVVRRYFAALRQSAAAKAKVRRLQATAARLLLQHRFRGMQQFLTMRTTQRAEARQALERTPLPRSPRISTVLHVLTRRCSRKCTVRWPS
jgi:hypothetical protein